VLELTLSAGRQAYLLCVDGGVDVKVEAKTTFSKFISLVYLAYMKVV
jgi:hypothetical protein